MQTTDPVASTGRLVASDPGGEAPDFSGDPSPATLAANNFMVIYEMPTAWANMPATSDEDIGVGTFRDVLACPRPIASSNGIVSNWDFVGGFKDRARALFQERCAADGVSATDADARFLVVGEELSLPMALLTQGRLTSVGVPMILAGDEFADEHSRFDQFGNVTQNGGKQVDPVNYGRLEGTDPTAQMRHRILAYVSRLVKFRTLSPALGVNGMDPVVVLANFSNFFSTASESAANRFSLGRRRCTRLCRKATFDNPRTTWAGSCY